MNFEYGVAAVHLPARQTVVHSEPDLPAYTFYNRNKSVKLSIRKSRKTCDRPDRVRQRRMNYRDLVLAFISITLYAAINFALNLIPCGKEACSMFLSCLRK